jgi:hypothetical protein
VDDALDGFCIGPVPFPVTEGQVDLDLNEDGDKTDDVETQVILFMKNPSGLNIKEEKKHYP